MRRFCADTDDVVPFVTILAAVAGVCTPSSATSRLSPRACLCRTAAYGCSVRRHHTTAPGTPDRLLHCRELSGLCTCGSAPWGVPFIRGIVLDYGLSTSDHDAAK